MSSTLDLPALGLSPEFDRAVPLACLLMELAQPLILQHTGTRWPISPRIIATATRAEGMIGTGYSMVGRLTPDESVLHVDSLAK